MKKYALVMTAFGVMTVDQAQAAGIDFTPITSVVDVTTLIAALGTIAALKFGVPFTKWAYHQVTSLFGGGR